MGGDRITPETIRSVEERLLYLKEIFIYTWSANKIPPQSRCLDVGCGAGYGTRLLADGLHDVTGIDISALAVKNARCRYAKDNCQFQAYNGKTIPFDDESFDTVTCFHVLEHVRDDRYLLQEIRRVLKKGGNLFLSTPNSALRLKENQKPWNIFHVREYTAAQLATLLSREFFAPKILGINAIDAVRDIEESRIKNNQRLAAYDIFNLRRIIPACIMSRVVGLTHRLTKQPNTKQEIEIAEDDPFFIYQIGDRDTERALDLVALCTK